MLQFSDVKFPKEITKIGSFFTKLFKTLKGEVFETQCNATMQLTQPVTGCVLTDL